MNTDLGTHSPSIVHQRWSLHSLRFVQGGEYLWCMIKVGNDHGVIAHYRLASVALRAHFRSHFEARPLRFLRLKRSLELAFYAKCTTPIGRSRREGSRNLGVVLREDICQETRWLT